MIRFVAFSVVALLVVVPAQADDGVVFPVEGVVVVTADGERHSFDVEFAVTPDQRSRGLMYRLALAEDAGMLLLLDRPVEFALWMKDTYVSLDILFLGEGGRVVTISEATEPLSEESIPSGVSALAALEVVSGTTQRLGIDHNSYVEHRAFGNAPQCAVPHMLPTLKPKV